ncbi:MAG: metal ABC transporter substrate-binding protein [Promethearchaeota archaeon]
MREKQLVVVFGILLVTFGVIGGFPNTSAQSPPALRIAVSIQPLAGIVREVGGVQADVAVLLPEGIEPHAFSLTQSVIDAANAADMLVLTGHFNWEEELATQVGKPYVTLGDYENFGAMLLPLFGHVSVQSPLFLSSQQHDQNENLHGYWLLPQNAIAIANATRNLCASLNSTYTQYWENRFTEFVTKVSDFETFVSEQNLLYQLSNKKVIITFPAEAYIAETLGLQVKGLLMESENVFISGPELLAVEQTLRNGSIDLILASDVAQLQAAGEFAQQLSADSGVPLVWIRAIFSILEDYVGIMAYNIGVITTGVSVGIPPAADFLSISMPVIILAAVLAFLVIIELVLLIRCSRARD